MDDIFVLDPGLHTADLGIRVSLQIVEADDIAGLRLIHGCP